MPDRVPPALIRSLGVAALTVGFIVVDAHRSRTIAAPVPSAGPAANAIVGPAASPTARDVGVVVNGTAVVFDQSPIVRDGRVYVPLRGIFERLGAGVVFNAGHIAASAGPHAVALALGDTSATVDGVVQTLDAPPIVVAGRTLVPLRFVAQALGATVAYDATARNVAIDAPVFPKPPTTTATTVTSAGTNAQTIAPTIAPTAPTAPTGPTGAPGVPPAVPSAPPHARAAIALRTGETPIAIRLLRLEPAANGKIASDRPEISATFAEAVDPATVRLVLDGTDLTSGASISPRSFVVVPPAELAPGSHEISLAGRTPDRDPFLGRWSFETTSASETNYLSGLEPTNGTRLTATRFAVSGYTRPHARVRIVGTTSPASTAFADGSDASAIVETVADRTGFFEASVALADRGSGAIDVRIASIAVGGDVAVRTLRLRQ